MIEKVGNIVTDKQRSPLFTYCLLGAVVSYFSYVQAAWYFLSILYLHRTEIILVLIWSGSYTFTDNRKLSFIILNVLIKLIFKSDVYNGFFLTLLFT